MMNRKGGVNLAYEEARDALLRYDDNAGREGVLPQEAKIMRLVAYVFDNLPPDSRVIMAPLAEAIIAQDDYGDGHPPVGEEPDNE